MHLKAVFAVFLDRIEVKKEKPKIGDARRVYLEKAGKLEIEVFIRGANLEPGDRCFSNFGSYP